MQLLFLPYNPSGDRKEGDKAIRISRHKHAATEHHRKSKLLKKAGLKNAEENRIGTSQTNGEPVDGQAPAKHPQVGTYSQWMADEQDRSIKLSPRPKSLLGQGRLDPFDVYCAPSEQLIVHEMVDHGKWASTNSKVGKEIILRAGAATFPFLAPD